MLKKFSKRLAISWAKLHTLLKTDLGIATCLTLIWQLAITTAGYIIDTKLNLPTTGLFEGMPHGLLGHTLRWDAGWYLAIINSDLYQNTSSQGAIFAFYPLYPILVMIVAKLSFGILSLQAASFVITTLATIAILTGLFKVSAHLLFNRYDSLLIALLFIVSPAALFLHAFYSEAVFIAIGTWAYLFALKRQWGYMALLLAILTAARLPAVLFIALCGLEFLRAHSWNFRKSLEDRSLFWFLITPTGFITYSLWCYIVSGDALAMFHAYTAPDGWAYQVFNPNILITILRASMDLFHDLRIHGLEPSNIVNFILPISSLALLFITALYALLRAKGKFVPLGIFNLLSILLFTLNSNVVSIHRYSLACISLFIIVVFFFARHKNLRWMLYSSLPILFTIQMGLLLLFTTGHFAG